MGGRKSPFPITLAIGLYNSLYYRDQKQTTGISISPDINQLHVTNTANITRCPMKITKTLIAGCCQLANLMARSQSSIVQLIGKFDDDSCRHFPVMLITNKVTVPTKTSNCAMLPVCLGSFNNTLSYEQRLNIQDDIYAHITVHC